MNSSYFYDLQAITQYFSAHLLLDYAMGDVGRCLPSFGFCKSRPIGAKNNIILKLNSIRHFCFVKDPFIFEEKMNKAVFRGGRYQQHRQLFINNTRNVSNANIGDTARGSTCTNKRRMTRQEQLRYKYIISLEGYDVASNLK